MSASPAKYHLFGIRHHGPGSSRSLLRALEILQPDSVLIEGPPECDAILPLAIAEGMEPPLAMLVYSPEEHKRAAFYPFAEFSPEWQAMLFALKRKIPVRFMDLQQAHNLALDKEDEAARKEALSAEAEDSVEPKSETVEDDLRHDPLGWLGRAAGFGGGEEWWEHMIEHRQDGSELFAAIAEAMTAVRAETPPPADPFEARVESLREAHMRKTIRAELKEGRERIAVVCGAWHVPALAELPSASADNDLLKGLPKIKVEATWAPWTYQRLAAESGYRAGVVSPAWYEHLWRASGRADSAAWFARVARLLRAEDIDCSSAHVIECVRLAETLAALRERPVASLAEMMEAAGTVLTTGDETPLRLIRRELIVGRKLGKVSADAPTVPLQRDVEKQQKALRLKPSATEEQLELDLRKDNDLARSRLLHRLRLLGVNWGETIEARAGKGTFREAWKIQWQPEFALSIIEAAPFGNTVEEASSARSIARAKELPDLASLTELVSQLLLADLPAALGLAMRELENRAALTRDVPQLMDSLTPLARISRYGDVRQTDAAQVLHVVDGIVVRVCVGLSAACQSLDDEASAAMANRIAAVNGAIKILEKPEHLAAWRISLGYLADGSGIHERLRGLSSRILLDDKQASPEDSSARMSRALSRGAAPEGAAAWLEGFLSGGGMVLVHDDTLLGLIDEWVCHLSPDHFTQTLPLVRRSFSTFPAMERRQFGQRIQKAKPGSAASPRTHTSADWDLARAEKVLPVLREIFGIEKR